MRDLSGLTCDALVAREFWLGDRCVSRACYVFLSLSDGRAVGWWFDDDSEEWRSEVIDVLAVPGTDEGWASGGSAWRYPSVDLASAFAIRGRLLSRWASQSTGQVAEARLEFADGLSVVFRYDCSANSDWVRVGVE